MAQPNFHTHWWRNFHTHFWSMCTFKSCFLLWQDEHRQERLRCSFLLPYEELTESIITFHCYFLVENAISNVYCSCKCYQPRPASLIVIHNNLIVWSQQGLEPGMYRTKMMVTRYVYSDVLTRIGCLVSPCFQHRPLEVEAFSVNTIGWPSTAVGFKKVQIYLYLL